MIIRTDPFRELDRLLTQQVPGTAARPAAMPMDAHREKDSFYVHFGIMLPVIALRHSAERPTPMPTATIAPEHELTDTRELAGVGA